MATLLESFEDTLQKHGNTITAAGVVVLAVGAGTVQGVAVGVLVLAGSLLIAAIFLFWGSIRTLFGETRMAAPDAFALGSSRLEEEQKHAVLRALKDIEFERSVGKISDADYHELVARYRGEAKRLLRILDGQSDPKRARAQELIRERLAAEKSITDLSAKASENGEHLPAPESVTERASGPQFGKVLCRACSIENDTDARFCKKCGERVDEVVPAAVASPEEPRSEEA